MLITKYTAILLESARSTEARNTALSRSDAWSSSLESAASGRRPVRRRHFVYRNATFLEPHLQGIRRRDSRSSDSDHDERSTEDDERSLLRSSPRTRLPPPPPPPPDDEPPPLKPREFFERLQTQAMREAQDRKHRSRDLSLKDNQLFRPVDAEGSLGDSLSQKCDIPRAASARHKETRQQEFRL
ncbi:uncharacterized protein LOC113495609 isoform X2 [Trichoplusia ni]|uniref:Uncharacterized protein LOC113495609 isoform X2 n=1 Tax=Trichoplusia ni TaxID=7111 RepID=A0A7E5VPI0_TRINI|nr:uncharacterized protein LOC113495609 isoform X2 [Trichoplusia ni]XP_026730231.1 uncharacterized protein LOC113495609 isoform X2 [Trichoplusia ni]XP_026730232.1 uncharacterized protein LOC113495609 isoform X2 [Trichoplusia ni]